MGYSYALSGSIEFNEMDIDIKSLKEEYEFLFSRGTCEVYFTDLLVSGKSSNIYTDKGIVYFRIQMCGKYLSDDIDRFIKYVKSVHGNGVLYYGEEDGSRKKIKFNKGDYSVIETWNNRYVLY